MNKSLRLLALTAILIGAAHFGIFYAWVCTTMWGLDAADPRIAIAAMQAMNATIRNAAFAPVFFGTPVLLLLTAVWLALTKQRLPAFYFGIAGALVLFGSVFLTMLINVPMNEALAELDVPDDIPTARNVWASYSPDWQFWNGMRTLMSGLGLLAALIGLIKTRQT